MFTRASIIAALVATASAFTAPTLPTMGARKSAVSSMQMQDKSYAMPFLSRPPALDGSMAGDVGFDPLGFTNYFDLKWLREAELKHGRICMLATTGILVQEVIRLPGDAFSAKFALDAWAQAPRGGMLQILVAIGLIEMVSNRFAITATTMFQNPARVPGDLGFDPLSLGTNPATRAKYELAEVTHGRAAMMGLSGMIHQMIVSKQPIIDQLLNFRPITEGFKVGGAAGNLGY
uniref:Uncharacterized protein n=1 Tax=Hemiselmis andersenii TaxID=464988 RepID=A0A7S0TG21_HEMAN|mmetsp:Transcript_1224/g.2963  ORF Transcript_1224/g.2963 Transcript_1224/m.2963 type:complete len:233 (+) Transcript_1224:42-740(+)